ncbi:MAG: hypothetical protein K2I66_08390 [Bacteroidales bacterium]|nr:hypothetical protein [Bacteroidales bacterium]
MKAGETKIHDRGEAYRYILETKQGFVDEIRISEDLFEDFYRIGYIHLGMDGQWRERWQITDFGESQFQSYLELFDQEADLDDILNELEKLEAVS